MTELDHRVTEQAVLQVKSGQVEEFIEAFTEAQTIIADMPGCRRVSLSRCVEQTNQFLLLVEWDRIEDHTHGFRESPEYERWRSLLHHFYEPFPIVEHYTLVTSHPGR